MNKLFIYLLWPLFAISCIPTSPKGNTGKQQRPTRASLLELPAVRPGEVIIVHSGYTASFNSMRMIPNWVAYELTARELLGTVRRPSNSPFQPDPDYRGKQPDRSDYSHSGWDKGHLAPCADMKWSEQAMIESFYFTNVCPQNHNFNEKDWHKLEEKARSIARKKGSVYIVSGPIVTTIEYGKLGKNQVIIPDFFFKAFLFKDETGFHSIAYVMPNRSTGHSLSEFAMTVNELEKILELDLFTRLDNKIEEFVEGQLILSDWE